MAFWTKKPADNANGAGPEAAPPVASMPPMHVAAPSTLPASPQPLQSPAASPANAGSNMDSPQQPEMSEEQRRKIASASKMVAAAFGEIVSLLMRTPNYKHLMLSDLEWFVVPAVASGQFTLAEAQSKTSGITQPMGVVLWARVSAEVDKRLHENLDQPIRLKPAEWTSGDNIWLIEAAGESRVIEALIKRMRETIWAGKPVRLRARDKDGKPAIGTMPSATSAANGAASTM
jgi:hemolysin-activating ACP:hemolysin acyltransferase